MYFVKNSVLTVLFALLIVFPLSSGIELNLTAGETDYFNISIPYSSITHFNFSITGDLYLGSYPSNITVSIGNYETSDWEYNVYPTSQPARVNSVVNAWSDNPSSNTIDFLNISEGYLGEMFYFGNLVNNVFGDNGGNSLSEQGYLGISTADSSSLGSQIVTITSYNKTIHAFIPSIVIEFASTAFYITSGGSTYYCNTEHNLPFDPLCDLSVTSAINPTHLAREVDRLSFDYTEPVNNPYTTDKINNVLQSCSSFPCKVGVKVTSDSAGKIIIDNFDFNGSAALESLPANISISENSSSYILTINNSSALSEVKYFYGERPKLYFIPFQAENEVRTLNANQITRLNKIQNEIANDWDNLTNNSFPLDFIFYNLTSPYILQGLSTSNSYSEFQQIITNSSLVSVSPTSILVMLDIWDYYPQIYPHNAIGQGGDIGLFGTIYINGLYNKSITTLNNYNSEIIKNVVLHEIAHSFIGYPQSTINNQDLFYTFHPAGFREDNLFPDTYDVALSPTGNEGYFDIYSIMNPVRVYMSASQIGREIELSDFDRMLMGLISPSLKKNYTFYEGNITLSGNDFVPTFMKPAYLVNTSEIYPYNSKELVYDTLTNNTSNGQGTSTTFSVSKQNQNGKALWVFATDFANPENFKVFNNNAASNVTIEYITVQGETTSFNRTLPVNYTSGVPITVNITLNFDSNDCAGAYVETLPSGWNVTSTSGNGAPYYNSVLNNINWAPIDGPLCGGSSSEIISYVVVPNSTQSGTKTIMGQFSTDGISIYLNSSINQNTSGVSSDTTPPSISNLVSVPSSPATYSQSQTYRFNITVTDSNLDKVIIEFNGTNRTTTRTGNVNSFSITGLKAGSYNYKWIANDTFRNQNTSTTQTFVIDKAVSQTSLRFDKVSPQIYGNSVNASCNVILGQGSAVLYRNGIDVTSSENGKNVNLGSGSYNYNCTLSSSQNYTSSQNTSSFTINKANGNLTLLLNGANSNISIIEGISVNVSVISPYVGTVLYRNGINVTNESGRFIQLPAGSYNYTAVNTGNQNYSSISQTYFVLVTIVPLDSLVFDIDLSRWNLSTTTNFSRFNRTELSNLSGVVFDNSFGKIRYLQKLNLNQSRSLIGLIEIIQNRLWINSSLIPEFNVPAEITFYNVTLTSPLIKLDGNDCPASICKINNYDTENKTYSFNVTGFSSYEIIEMPVTNPPATSGGGRGGSSSGGGTTIINNANTTKPTNSTSNVTKTNNSSNNNTINLNGNEDKNSTNLTVNTPITGNVINGGGNSTGKILVVLGVIFLIVLAVVLNLVKIYKKKKLESYISN